MAETKIEWTSGPNGELGYSFNPWIGCQRISPGCEHCYAEAYDKRVGGAVDVDGEKKLRWGPTAPRIRTSAANWRKPLKWNREAEAAGERRKVFCSSLADVFEERPELAMWRLELFALIRSTPALDWLLLTKRPENIRRLILQARDLYPPQFHGIDGTNANALTSWLAGIPPPNVWIGTTVEDQMRCERVVHLRKVPAVVRFLSCEPMLAEIRNIDLGGIDWVICGGESGPGARTFDIEWARSLKTQCGSAGVAFFMKQFGVHTRMRPEEVGGDPELEPMRFYFRKGDAGSPHTWPEDLRIRQFPEVRR